MEYSGINLPENVIIVENKYGQGYVVSEGNSLDNARNWAERSDWEPKEYKYKNGTFTLRVTNAAGHSSQGGKLSFWNCQIRTEDEKEFLIGISSDCLAELIINNTLINGKCQNKIYFAKYKGNQTYAITENMPSYKLALKDKQLKETKRTSKYEVGSIVSGLTVNRMCAGVVYEYIKTYRTTWQYKYANRIDMLVVINKNPIKYYWMPNANWCDYRICTDELFKSLMKGVVSGRKNPPDIESVIKESKEKEIEKFKELEYCTGIYRCLGELAYSTNPNKIVSIEEVEKELEIFKGRYNIKIVREEDLLDELKLAIEDKAIVRE